MAHFIALLMALFIHTEVLNLIGYVLVLTVGVCHGANDLKIFYLDQQVTLKIMLSFILKYSIIVILGIGMFFIIPDLILLLFLVISGFHFGQEHYESDHLKSSLPTNFFYLSYGLLIIMTLIHIHHKESLPVINELIWTYLNKDHTKWIVATLVATTFISGFFSLKNLSWIQIITEILFLAFILVLFIYGNLVWGFAVYFVLWHSIPSIKTQITHLYGRVTLMNVYKYISSSLLYWLGAMIFLAVLYYLLRNDNELFLAIVVAFLGGITFPHVFVMNTINRK